MLDLTVPGFRDLRLHHLVMDCNGTISCDGALIEGVAPLVEEIARVLEIHVLTADTYGTAARILEGLPCRVCVMPPAGQSGSKRAYVENLGADCVACIGNGRNDRSMLQAAGLSIAVVQSEGAAREALQAAHVIAPDIVSALGLLLRPSRLLATLRD